nr:JmjC domain-containing protein [Tanacetum cinerariifolium]
MMTLVVALFLRPPSPSPATPTRSPTHIATLEAELKATKILHRDAVVLFAKRIKKLESKLNTKMRKLVLSDSDDEEDARQSQELAALLNLANDAFHEQSHMSTPSQPAYSEPSTEKEISPTTLDAGLSLSQSKVRDRAAKIIYKRLKKQQSSSNTTLSDAAIPAVDPDSAVRVDSADDLVSAGVDSAIRVDSTDDLISASTGSAGADVSEDTFVTRMVDLMNQRRKAIAEMKAKAKRDKPMTPAQQREYMRTFVKNQSTAIYTTGWTWKDVQGLFDDQLQNVYDKIQRVVDLNNAKAHHHHFKRSGDTLESLESKKLKSSPIPADTPIAAGVPATTAASGSTKPTVPLRKSSRKKSMARKRTLPKPVSLALVSDVRTWEIIPTEFGLGEIHVITRVDGTIKRFYTLRELMHWACRADLMVLYGMVSDKYKLERATCIGLGLWSDLRTLITAREDRDVSIIWDDHDQWEI